MILLVGTSSAETKQQVEDIFNHLSEVTKTAIKAVFLSIPKDLSGSNVNSTEIYTQRINKIAELIIADPNIPKKDKDAVKSLILKVEPKGVPWWWYLLAVVQLG